MARDRKIKHIDFTQPLQDEDAVLLHEFLSADEAQEKGKRIKKFNQATEYTHHGTTFTLSHSLVRITETQPNSTVAILDALTNKKSYSYAVFDESEQNVIGQGGFGKVYSVLTGLQHQGNKMACQAFATKQVIKVSDFKIIPANILANIVNAKNTNEEKIREAIKKHQQPE